MLGDVGQRLLHTTKRCAGDVVRERRQRIGQGKGDIEPGRLLHPPGEPPQRRAQSELFEHPGMQILQEVADDGAVSVEQGGELAEVRADGVGRLAVAVERGLKDVARGDHHLPQFVVQIAGDALLLGLLRRAEVAREASERFGLFVDPCAEGRLFALERPLQSEELEALQVDVAADDEREREHVAEVADRHPSQRIGPPRRAPVEIAVQGGAAEARHHRHAMQRADPSRDRREHEGVEKVEPRRARAADAPQRVGDHPIGRNGKERRDHVDAA